MPHSMISIILHIRRRRGLGWLGVAAVCAVAGGAAAAAALPQGSSVAQLAAPLDPPRQAIVDGRIWRCVADSCAAGAQDGADSRPLWMECGHLAETFGAIASYQTGDRTLDPAKLAHCNLHAKASSHVG